MSLELEDQELQCLEDHGEGTCRGPVEYRYTGRGKSFPRCDVHWEKRLELEDRINRDYNPFGVAPPEGFDPAYAGERWDDDY